MMPSGGGSLDCLTELPSQYLLTFWLSYWVTDSETNPNNNQMMRRADFSVAARFTATIIISRLKWFFDMIQKNWGSVKGLRSLTNWLLLLIINCDSGEWGCVCIPRGWARSCYFTRILDSWCFIGISWMDKFSWNNLFKKFLKWTSFLISVSLNP